MLKNCGKQSVWKIYKKNNFFARIIYTIIGIITSICNTFVIRNIILDSYIHLFYIVTGWSFWPKLLNKLNIILFFSIYQNSVLISEQRSTKSGAKHST